MGLTILSMILLKDLSHLYEHSSNKFNQKSLEKEILSNLAKYALELNQDPPPGSDEIRPQGYGSIAMVNLLFKSVLYFRDKNNDLEYKVAQLEKQVKLLSSQEKNA